MEAMGTLSRSDRYAVAAFVEATCLARKYSDQIRKDGVLKDGKRHPLCIERNRQQMMQIRLSVELGLTPAARTRMESVKPQVDDNPITAFLNRNKNRAESN